MKLEGVWEVGVQAYMTKDDIAKEEEMINSQPEQVSQRAPALLLRHSPIYR